jgi:GNAT superfamily N-acetyltransferase
MIEYKDDDWLENLTELKEVIKDHYEELSVTKTFPLDPDWEAYKQILDVGRLKFVTCKEDGVLIGYIIFFVMPHLHYKTCLTAFEDIYFLKKEYRKGRIGLKMFQFAEKLLKEQGINRIIYNTKVHSDNSSLFEYLGYSFMDKVFTKLL